MRDVVFHVDATAEMQAAAAYYEEQTGGLGEDFLDEIEHCLHRIEQFPQLWSIYDGEFRRCLLRRFPCGLIYRHARRRIFIIAVSHLKQEPGYWRNRR